jgi:hypothetical protein
MERILMPAGDAAGELEFSQGLPGVLPGVAAR